MKRRAFLTGTAMSLGGLTLPSRGRWTGSLAAQSRPALSELTLAQYIQGARQQGRAAVDGLLTEVTTDVRSFLRNRFALAPAQEAFISRFAVGDIESVRTAFERGLVGLNQIRVRIPAPNQAPECSMRLEREFRQLESGMVVEDWSLVIESK